LYGFEKAKEIQQSKLFGKMKYLPKLKIDYAIQLQIMTA